MTAAAGAVASPLKLHRSRPGWRRVAGLALGLATVIVAVTLPFWTNRAWLNIAVFITVVAIGATGLNVLTGYTGQVSLGHAFFIAVGAYTGGVLGADHGVDGLLWLPAAGAVAAAFGLVVGPTALRLRGLYLGIVTIGLVFIGQHIWNNWYAVSGGPAGRSFPSLVVGGLDTGHEQTIAGVALSTDAMVYYVALAVLALSMAFVYNMARTRLGRAMQAVREREIAAALVGVDVSRTKLAAFVISSFITGVAGGLYGVALHYAVPDTWDLILSIQFVAVIIVGGVGTVWGGLLGAVFVGALPKVLDTYSANIPLIHSGATGGGIAAGDAANILYGVLIVGFLVLAPNGVSGLVSRVLRVQSRRPAGSTSAPAAPAAAGQVPSPAVEEESYR